MLAAVREEGRRKERRGGKERSREEEEGEEGWDEERGKGKGLAGDGDLDDVGGVRPLQGGALHQIKPRLAAEGGARQVPVNGDRGALRPQ